MSDSDIAYAICGVGDIPNRRARAFSLLRASGEAFHIVLVRWDRKIHGYVNRCPHHGTPLDWERDQFFDGTSANLMCGKHGAQFALDSGVCLDGPCAGEKLERLKLSIDDGDICLHGVALAED
jgi:nitrite reductase/ring-hydroxylating ferredoxin subunit